MKRTALTLGVFALSLLLSGVAAAQQRLPTVDEEERLDGVAAKRACVDPEHCGGAARAGTR